MAWWLSGLQGDYSRESCRKRALPSPPSSPQASSSPWCEPGLPEGHGPASPSCPLTASGSWPSLSACPPLLPLSPGNSHLFVCLFVTGFWKHGPFGSALFAKEAPVLWDTKDSLPLWGGGWRGGEEEFNYFFFFLNSSKNNKITALKLSSQAERSLLFSSHNICVFVKCLNMESY